MKKTTKKIIGFMMAVSMVAGLLTTNSSDMAAVAAKKATITSRKLSLTVGQKKSIIIKNKKKSAKYSFKSSAKKIAGVSKKGVVTALKAGKANVTVTENYKKGGKKKSRKVGVIKVTVSEKKQISPTPVVTDTINTTACPTQAATIEPTLSPTHNPEPTASATPDAYKTELFTLNITENKIETVEGSTCTVEMTYFTGNAAGDYFNGSVLKESADVKKTFKDGTVTSCARYILDGKDKDGNSCQIFIQDEGVMKDGAIFTQPVILTTGSSLVWMETADIQGRVAVNDEGERSVTYVWNEDNTEEKALPEAYEVDMDASEYTEEVFTFNINIGATDSLTGNNGSASMIHFTGSSDCNNFKGNITNDCTDTRLKYNDRDIVETLSARYILEGTDVNGKPCKIYVENNGVQLNDMYTAPIIITDCPEYAWIETAPLRGTVSWEPGLTIHMWTKQGSND